MRAVHQNEQIKECHRQRWAHKQAKLGTNVKGLVKKHHMWSARASIPIGFSMATSFNIIAPS